MRDRGFLLVLLVLVLLGLAVALNAGRLYAWLLAMHGAPSHP